jgi:uncharacterized protein YdhG (YjbR/CyaY superfamily)
MTGPRISTFAAYVASLGEPLRDTAEAVRTAILRAAPDADEAIKYGMPAFLYAGEPFLYFAVWKSHVGVYPLYRDAGELEPVVAPYRDKKDTLRFELKRPLPLDVIAAVARYKRACVGTAEKARKR